MLQLEPLELAKSIGAPIIMMLIAASLKGFIDFKDTQRARALVLKAEKEAFKAAPEAFAKRVEELRDSQDTLELRTRELNQIINNSQAALQVGNLFDLYSKQIEKYQTETQSRAGWSFIFAIISMFAGLGFVVLGGMHILTNPGWEHVAAATGISGIGGAVGAYITKTFLDVHRLSLSQLNHYFRQPVLNAHVLTAQRIADQIADESSRQNAYQQILTNVVALIREDFDSQQVWSSEAHIAKTAPAKKPRGKKATPSSAEAINEPKAS